MIKMQKKDKKNSVSEADEEAQVANENGKRPGEGLNKDGTKRIKTKSLYRQPTVNELNRLQETENLFNSNLFRLQIEEILQEVKVKEKTEKKFQQWFQQIKSHLLTIPEDDKEYDLTEQTLAKKLKVKLPISKEMEKTKCIFKFHKFKDVEIVGSYAVGSSINSKLRIDVQITIPADTYTKNDSINYRYHKKRAAYLAVIASHLNGLQTIEEITYTLSNGQTKPVIDIKPTGKLSNHFTVRINLTCEPEAYKLHRFSPSRNNLREAWLLETQTDSDIVPPTPYYNSGVLTDLTASENEHFLNKILRNNDNLKQAVILLKIWLRQRSFQVSGHIVSLFVAYLVQMKRINNFMSSYQIVRNIWISLKTSEWDTKGITLSRGGDTPPLTEFHQHFPIVFLDVTGYYNLCWNMCRGTYNALRRESVLAVEMLDNGNINSFIPLFMTKIETVMQFDHILSFKDLPQLKEAIITRAPKEVKLNYGIDQLALVTDTIHSLLSKGLGTRADLILQLVEADFSWPIKKSPEKAKKDGYQEKLSFGLILNPENALNIVDKGPSANLPDAEEFRAFWGDKSELRRFQDGAITETCVWEGDTIAERRTVTKQIIDYLFQFKYNIASPSLHHTGAQLAGLLARRERVATCEESALLALSSFDELRRDLRALTSLPLHISAVYGVSAVFSYSDPLPPLPHAPLHKPWQRGDTCLIKDAAHDTTCVPGYTPVCKAVLELGHSGKWPGDIEAFRCLKAAFNLQIADRIKTQYSLPTQSYPTHIDVLKNGLVFRLVIAHPKEITLLRREKENGVVKFRESEESVRLQIDTVLLPRLRGALHGLHQKHPAFGPTACLLKRWLHAHLLAPPHFPDTLSELLAASVFVRAEPLVAPQVPLAGFLRTLKLLADTDWTSTMLLIDFNADMTREEIASVERRFSERDVTAAPHIFVVTSYDGDLPSIWSAHSPSLQVLARVQQLAGSTLRYMQGALSNMQDNLLGAFVPSLAGYDVLIHLHSSLVPYACERVDQRAVSKPSPDEVADDIIPTVEFHPVMRYLEDLRSAYGDFALFFHDSYGGEVIAVLWKPDINEPRELQLTSANALKLVTVDGETQYKVNTQALIEDFRILGDGLVRDITVT